MVKAGVEGSESRLIIAEGTIEQHAPDLKVMRPKDLSIEYPVRIELSRESRREDFTDY
jgi:hypothetical protein